jgi:hypothetical protein
VLGGRISTITRNLFLCRTTACPATIAIPLHILKCIQIPWQAQLNVTQPEARIVRRTIQIHHRISTPSFSERSWRRILELEREIGGCSATCDEANEVTQPHAGDVDLRFEQGRQFGGEVGNTTQKPRILGPTHKPVIFLTNLSLKTLTLSSTSFNSFNQSLTFGPITNYQFHQPPKTPQICPTPSTSRASATKPPRRRSGTSSASGKISEIHSLPLDAY